MNKPNLNNVQFVEFIDQENSNNTAGNQFANWKLNLIKQKGQIHSFSSGVVGGLSSEGYVTSLAYIHVFYFPFVKVAKKKTSSKRLFKPSPKGIL